MRRLLIKEVDLWSMVRTVFPLFWIVNTVIVLIVLMAVRGSIGEYAVDIGIEQGMMPGGIGLFFASLILGLLGGILYTAITAIVIICYNALTALGGGIRIVVDDESVSVEGEIAGENSHESEN
jgi:hypothetical protein